jgi:hypothetical protein
MHQNWRQRLQKVLAGASKRRQRTRLEIEALEDRPLPSPVLPFGDSINPASHFPQSAAVNAPPGPATDSASATHFVITGLPGITTAGIPITVTVTADDASNHVATSYTGTVSMSATDHAAVFSPPGQTLTSGVGIFGVTLATAGTQTVTAGDNIRVSASNKILVSPGAATHFLVTAPSGVTGDAGFVFTVTAEDKFNNTAPGYKGAVAFSSSDASSNAQLPADNGLNAGIGTFSATLGTPGQQIITATDTSNGTIGGNSAAVTVTPNFIIADNDLADDSDGILQMAIALGAQQDGTADILAVADDINDTSALDLAAEELYYGETAIPMGRTTVQENPGNQLYAQDIIDSYPLPAAFSGSGENIPDAVSVFRTELSMAPDGSVTLYTAGPETNISNLLNSPANYDGDGLPNGSTLIALKVKQLVVMGGDYTNVVQTGVTLTQSSSAVGLNSTAGLAVGDPVTLTDGNGSLSTTIARIIPNVGVNVSAPWLGATTFNGTLTDNSFNSRTLVGGSEANFGDDPAAAANVASNFPRPVIYLGFTFGFSMDVGQTLPTNTGANDIARFALNEQSFGTFLEPCYDSLAFLYALRGLTYGSTNFFTLNGPGVQTIDSGSGANVFTFTGANTGMISYATRTGNDYFLSSGTASAASIEAELNSLITSPVAPPATHFAIAMPAAASSGEAVTFTLTAETSSNTQAASYTGTVSLTSSDTQAILPPGVTLDNGVGVFDATFLTSGNQALIASDSLTPVISGTAPITISAGPATHYAVSAPSVVTAGGEFGFTVMALDSFNNIATGYTGAVTFKTTDHNSVAAPRLPIKATLASGVGIFSAVLYTAGTQIISTSDVAVGTIFGSTNPIKVVGAAATHFSIFTALPVYPGITTGLNNFASTGLPAIFTVTAVDSFRNVAPNYSGTAQVSSSDTDALLPASVTITSGVGTFSAKLMTVGDQTVTVDDAANNITGTSSPIITRGLVVTDFTPTPSGFIINFNQPFNPDTVLMYTTATVADDILLATTGVQISIRGSVLIDPTDDSLTFVKTDSISSAGTFNPANGLLAAGKYTLTLRSLNSAGNGFQDALGNPLDGTDSGDIANYVLTFSVSALPVAVGIPDFARGPTNTDAIFLPSTLSNGSTFSLSYNNPSANPPTGTATITFSTTATTLAGNIQSALSSGGLSPQVGVNTSAGNVPNSVVVVTDDVSSGTNVLVTFQGPLAQATNQLLSSTTRGVSISQATIDVANNIPDDGVPIALSSGIGVTSGAFTLQYNPSLLMISGAVSKVAGSSFTLVSNDTVTGTAVLSLSSPTSLSTTARPIPIGSLLASVPFSATQSYGAQQLLHFSTEQLNGNAGPIKLTGADGVEVAAYFGDATDASGPLTHNDSSAVFAVGSAVPNVFSQTLPGFAAFPNLDPAIIGNVSLTGAVSQADAGALLQEVAGMERTTIPYVPIGLPIASISAFPATARASLPDAIKVARTVPAHQTNIIWSLQPGFATPVGLASSTYEPEAKRLHELALLQLPLSDYLSADYLAYLTQTASESPLDDVLNLAWRIQR